MWENATDAEFRVAVERMNALFPEARGFRLTKALKEHTDIFGELIREGETYYNREYAGWGGVIKMSKSSMDRFCIVLLFENDPLAATADKVTRQTQTAQLDLLNKISEH